MRRLNNKGFAVSGVLYPILVLFLMLLLGVLNITSARKTVFDKTKNDIIDELNDPNSQNTPVITVIGKDITILNNTNIPGFNFDLKDNVTAVNSAGEPFTQNEIMVKSDPEFNPSRSGTYHIIYTVSDQYGKRASANRTVRVVNQQEQANSWYYSYTGSYEKLTIPKNALYQIQAWGASGYGGDLAGKGSYTRGEIELAADEELFLFVGEGGTRKENIYGILDENFNGGGSYICKDVRYTAGGATDIRVKGPTTSEKEWNDTVSLQSRIMVAAGGGAAGQTTRDNNPTIAGGPGGTLTSKGGNGSSKGNSASQTTGFALGIGESYGSLTTECGANNGSAGGGGYYGGYASKSPGSSGAGGSSYISGFEGSPLYATKIFSNATMIPGDASMPNHTGNGTMTGNAGNGYIKILQLKVVNE